MWVFYWFPTLILLLVITLIVDASYDKKLSKMKRGDPGYAELENKKSNAALPFGAWLVLGAPICMVIDAAEAIGAGAAIIILIFFGLCACGGWLSSGATHAAPPPPPQPPTYVEKHWQHSPGGIETQKFEGDYDGSLNKEFENN